LWTLACYIKHFSLNFQSRHKLARNTLHHRVPITKLGHLLTRSGLSHPLVSPMVFLVTSAFWCAVFITLGN
jgi:hypothetical protein